MKEIKGREMKGMEGQKVITGEYGGIRFNIKRSKKGTEAEKIANEDSERMKGSEKAI